MKKIAFPCYPDDRVAHNFDNKKVVTCKWVLESQGRWADSAHSTQVFLSQNRYVIHTHYNIMWQYLFAYTQRTCKMILAVATILGQEWTNQLT